MLTKTFGSAIFGVNALTTTIEVSIEARNRHHIVDLPDNAIKESLRWAESAIQSAGLKSRGKRSDLKACCPRIIQGKQQLQDK